MLYYTTRNKKSEKSQNFEKSKMHRQRNRQGASELIWRTPQRMMSSIIETSGVSISSSESSQRRNKGPSIALPSWSGKSVGPELERADDFAKAGSNRLQDPADNNSNSTIAPVKHETYAAGITEEVNESSLTQHVH